MSQRVSCDCPRYVSEIELIYDWLKYVAPNVTVLLRSRFRSVHAQYVIILVKKILLFITTYLLSLAS